MSFSLLNAQFSFQAELLLPVLHPHTCPKALLLFSSFLTFCARKKILYFAIFYPHDGIHTLKAQKNRPTYSANEWSDLWTDCSCKSPHQKCKDTATCGQCGHSCGRKSLNNVNIHCWPHSASSWHLLSTVDGFGCVLYFADPACPVAKPCKVCRYRNSRTCVRPSDQLRVSEGHIYLHKDWRSSLVA